MRNLPFLVVLLGSLFMMMSLHTHAQQQKYALIIGVKSYQYVQPLQNSLNDARDMATMLQRKGFTVVELYEPKTKREMQDGIRRYFSLIQDKPNAAGLVFYSGHGMQVKGVNYLIPTQADPQIEADLDDQCVNMDYVMRAIEQAGNQLNIFILDACRNNPFRSFSRSAEKGLSMVATPKGSYIVYATKPGSVASDGTGRNGLFTSKLLQYINTEGLNIEQVFKQVARDVAAASGDAQRPWIASDYTGDFFFTSNSETTTTDIRKPTTKTKPGISGVAETITVDEKVWLKKNLNVDRFANGDVIQEAKTIEEWKLAGENKQPAWCYFGNSEEEGAIYGKLYNWYAVSDPRGLAPKGWHVPSKSEFEALLAYVKRAYPMSECKQLKATTGWDWEYNGNGLNGTGFSALPGGYREVPYGANRSGFIGNGQYAAWWSSSEYSPNTNNALSFKIVGFSDVLQLVTGTDKANGFSVRCVKDEIAAVTTSAPKTGNIKKDSTKTDPTKQNLQKLLKKKKN